MHHHAAVDMAQERLAVEQLPDSHWDVKHEIVDYRERFEWEHNFEGQPAARR